MRSPSNKSEASNISLSQEGISSSIVEHGGAILLCSENGVIHDANTAALNMLGYSLAELKSLACDKIFDAVFLEVLENGGDQRKTAIDCCCNRKNGEKFPAEVSSVPLKGFHTEDLIVVHIIDLSLRRKLETEKIRGAEDRARALIERVSDGFISLDKNFRFTYLNTRAAALANRSVESLFGRNIWQEYPEIVDSEIYVAYHKAMIEQQEVAVEYFYPPLDIWLKHRIYPSPEGVSALMVDITEQKRLEGVAVMERAMLELYTYPDLPIEETLTLLLKHVRQIHPQMLCSILRAKDGRLYTWASPHLPQEFNQAIDGIRIAQGSGSCGTSAYLKQKVVIKDILTDPLTKSYHDLADKFELRSCWSYPILDNRQDVLGTFAIYYKTHHVLKISEQQTIAKACDILKNVLVNKASWDAVKKSEEIRRLILNAAMDAIICIDILGTITLWNPKAEKIFGWREEDVLGKPMADLIIPKRDRHRHDTGMAEYIRTGYGPILNKVVEVTALRRNGDEFPISLTILSVKQVDAEFFCAFIEDITERKEAQSQLQKANTQLVSAQQIAKLGYWELDLIGNTNYWSDQIFEICGIPSDKSPSLEQFTKLIHPDDQEEFLRSYTAALQGIPLLNPEYRLIRNDGRIRHVHLEASRVCNEDGAPVRLRGTLQDITRLKENELALIDLNAELNKQAHDLAKSNADLEQFAYITSHDLQEPLRMVTSFLGQIEKKYNDLLDDKGRQYIYFAVDGAIRMKRIISDLLEYSRVGRTDADPQKIDLNELLREIVQLNSAAIEEKNAEIIWKDLPVVDFFKTPLQTVLQNLIGNALKYQRPDVRPSVRVEAVDVSDHWQLAISDNGIGIDPKHFDKIFVLFRRLHNKEAYSGTGLGLAICKKIVEAHNGRIWVASVPGKGSTFYFTIPKQFSNLNITGGS